MFTYIQPLLVQVSGFAQAAVSPVLLVFGGGMIVGNLLGGRLADRRLAGSLAALVLVLGAMGLVLHNRTAMVVFVGLLGVAAFATVAPLQLRVLERARGTGQNLASSRNIAAFNLGNALGGVAGRDGDRHPGWLGRDPVGGSTADRGWPGYRVVERAPATSSRPLPGGVSAGAVSERCTPAPAAGQRAWRWLLRTHIAPRAARAASTGSTCARTFFTLSSTAMETRLQSTGCCSGQP